MKRISLLIASVLSLGVMLTPALALAADPCDANGDGVISTKESIQCGANGANGGKAQTSQQATDSFNNIVSSILNILTVVVGVLAVVMIILAGSRFITSSGNKEKVAAARRALVYALIGIVVAAMAQLIAQFVLHTAQDAQNPSTTTTSSTTSGACDPALGCH